MSDGNYNKNLLPYQDYRSGVRAGRAATIAKAKSALAGLIESELPELPEEHRARLLARFREMLESR